MRLFARVFKWTLLLALLFIVGALAALGVKGYTTFGRDPAGARLAQIQQSPQWRDGKFQNPAPMWSEMGRALRQMFDAVPGDVPSERIAVVQDSAATFATPPTTGLRVTWFGHSSTLVEIDGVKLLLDPLWGERASPVEWAGPERWYAPPIALRDLPPIDAVLISHDHYDHLDQFTIAAMKDWNTVFIVPLGVGADLEHWGIPSRRIIELDWWQATQIRDVLIAATPARHASGRLVLQADKTLWAGYALVGTAHRVFYSGDTGFHPALPDVGTRYGPFDLALIESGQYDADWPDWHMGPEQAVIAAELVRARALLPVHWGLLKLAHHSWTEPAERVLAAARCSSVAILIPRPGQPVEPTTHPEIARWWPAMPWRTASERPIVATKTGVDADRYDVPPCTRLSSSR
ncbi:MAG: hypothetical protein JWM78_3580 [Verrucomicrobiaceae bacterium]|nr:hypothetical protein [Verrucomicrobiaceae bacterium]